jgi:hypothetical protein
VIIQPSVQILVELFQRLFWFVSADDDHHIKLSIGRDMVPYVCRLKSASYCLFSSN